VGVDVNAAGKDQKPGRVNGLSRRVAREIRTDGADAPFGHADIGLE
jgi:hypothetical protein